MLRTGEQISVGIDGETLSGRVDKVDADSLAFTTKKNGPVIILRETVNKVRRMGRHWLPGSLLIGGGIAYVGIMSLAKSLGDARTLSGGRFPKSDKGIHTAIGFGAVGAGVILLWKGGAKTIYERAPKPPSRPAPLEDLK